MADEDDNIIEFGHSYGKEPETYKDIVLRAIETCRIELSKEMTKGGNITVMYKNQPIVINIPDQRQRAMETIKTLKNLMNRVFDNKMEEFYVDFESTIEDSYVIFLKKFLTLEPDQRTVRVCTKVKSISKTDVGNNVLNELEDFKLEVYRELFEQLLLLMQRKNDLSKKRVVVD